MTVRSQTRDVPPLEMRADVVPGSLNEEARTVDVVWTTGARVKRYDWFDGPYYEELSTDPAHVRMGRLQSGRAPVFLGHNSYNPDMHQGVVERAAIKAGEGTATLRFLTGDPAADKTWNKIRQGVLTSVSVGYSVHKVEETRGTDGTLPVRKAIDWEPYEISPVAMPADPAAHMRSEHRQSNPCEFIIRGEAPHEEKTMSEEVKTPAPAATRTQEQIDAAAAEVRAQLAERERTKTILTLSRKHNLPEEFSQRLIDAGTTVDDSRAAILDELAKRSDAVKISSPQALVGGEDARDKRLRGMGAAILVRAGAEDYFTRAAERPKFARHFKGVDLDGGEFRSFTLLDMARHLLEVGGVSTRGLSKLELVKRAIEFRSGGMQSTSDFSVLFENALHKMMLAAYALADDTWRRFCGTDTVPDFRASNRYRLGSLGVADDVNEGGEFKTKAIPDGSKFQISTGTLGNIIAITRQAIINDDMSALSSVSTQFGRSFGLTIETRVYALLNANSGLGPTQTDSQPFFHANRANVNATGSAISVDGLDADRVVMGKQKDPDSNEYLNMRPRVLLVPLGLEGTARVLNQSQFDPSVSGKIQIPNKVVGLFQDVVGTPRLTDTTRRYLFGNDPSAPAIKVVFLEGQGEAPVLESEMGFEVDGMRWRARLDVKAQMFDPKGAVTNAGS